MCRCPPNGASTGASSYSGACRHQGNNQELHASLLPRDICCPRYPKLKVPWRLEIYLMAKIEPPRKFPWLLQLKAKETYNLWRVKISAKKIVQFLSDFAESPRKLAISLVVFARPPRRQTISLAVWLGKNGAISWRVWLAAKKTCTYFQSYAYNTHDNFLVYKFDISLT